MKQTYTVFQTQTTSKVFRVHAESAEEAKRMVRDGDVWQEDEVFYGPISQHVIGQPESHEVSHGDYLIGKTFETKDPRERGRRVTVAAIDPDQTRGGQKARSTIYRCREHLYGDKYRFVRLQEHILQSKWREVTA